MKIALFGRYSSKMQDELSMDAQLAEMEAFATRQGWEIADRYLMPEVNSSDLARSPEFQRMLDDAKAKRWKLLLCHKLDRLGRDREMVVMFKAQLRRQGIEIRSVVENLSDSMEHRLLEGMYELFADHFRQNLASETRKGHRQLTREGYWKGGKPPYGYVAQPVEAGKRSRTRLVPCPKQGPVMEEVYRRIAAGESPGLVLRWVAIKTGEPVWQSQTLYARVRNPIYYGRLEYGRTSLPAGRPRKKLAEEQMTVGECEAIVSEELWKAANAKIAERSARQVRVPRRVDQPYLFSGLLKCQDCGGKIIGGNAGGRRVYRCIDRQCGSSSIRADILEPEVKEKMLDFLNSQDDRVKMLKAFTAELQPIYQQSQKDEADCWARLAEVRSRQRKLIEAVELGIGDISLVAERLRELKSQEAELVSAAGTAQAGADARVNANLEQLADAMEVVRDGLADGAEEDIQPMRNVLAHLFDIEVSPTKKKGLLVAKLSLESPRPNRGLTLGRSAPTIPKPSLLRVPVRKLSFVPGRGIRGVREMYYTPSGKKV